MNSIHSNNSKDSCLENILTNRVSEIFSSLGSGLHGLHLISNKHKLPYSLQKIIHAKSYDVYTTLHTSWSDLALKLEI